MKVPVFGSGCVDRDHDGGAVVCRREKRREVAGRIRHQRRAARPLARGDLPLGEGDRARSHLRRRVQRPGIAYEHEGQLDKARKAYEKAIELDPNNTQIRQNYELFKEINDRTSQAKENVASLLAVRRGVRRRVRAGLRPDYFEIPIETPIQPKMDVSPFQRVLVVGFVAGGTEDVDTNQETVRLLRSQLRTKSSLKVIDADVMPLIDIAQEQSKHGDAAEQRARGDVHVWRDRRRAPASQTLPLPKNIKEEKDLEPYERLFANTAYWKKDRRGIPEPADRDRHGAVHAASHVGLRAARVGESTTASAAARVVPVRTYMERKGFILRPKFVFIDGRTGATMYSESYREEILYNAQQNTPALSSYFELMDRLMPNFLSTLSSQKISGTRVLLK